MDTKDYYLEFLHLLEFEDADEERPYFIRICNRFQITEDVLKKSLEEHLPNYFHMELSGIRALLRLYVREWIGYEHLWEEPCIKIYYNVPGTNTGMYWLRESLREAGLPAEVCTPDLVTMVVLYGIIGLEEKLAVSNGCRHCAVNLMRGILSEKQILPCPDIRWSYGLLCNEAPKQDVMFEDEEPQTLHILVHKPTKSGCQKDHLTRQLALGFAQIRERYHMTENKALYKQVKMKRFLLAMRREQILRYLNQRAEFVIGNEEVGLIETLLLSSFRTDVDEIAKLLAGLLQEMKDSVMQGKACQPMKYRYAVYYTPVCNPEYGKIMENHGIGLLNHTAFASTAVAMQGQEPLDDMAIECMGMLIGKDLIEEAEKICHLIQKNHLDGIVLGMFPFDRWMGALHNLLQKIVEEQTGKHVLMYETDFWNQEVFTGDRMDSVVETLVLSKEP